MIFDNFDLVVFDEKRVFGRNFSDWADVFKMFEKKS